MFGSDFIHITDHRGFESGFFWSDVQQFLGVYKRDKALHKDRKRIDDLESVIGEKLGVISKDEEEWVSVKFRNDHEGFYSLMFKMPVKEFIAEVMEQLNHPARICKDDEKFLSSAHNEILTFNIDGINVKLQRGDVWMARERCTGSCDLTTYCPFFGKRNIEVGSGCRRIFDAYNAGQYTVSNGIFEEADE